MPSPIGKLARLPGRAWGAVRRHPRASLLALLVLAAAVAFGAWRYALHQWHQAQAAVAADDPAAARARLRVCLWVWPWSPDVHLLAARAARMAGDLPAAEAHLNRCRELQGEASEGMQLEFLLLRVQTGEVDELAPALIDAVEKGHPDGPLILETMARAFIQRLRYKPAYACLSRWVELRPDSAKAHQWRGWALERLNNHKAAREEYHRALELDPDLVPVRLRVAEMFLEDKQAPEALPHLERLYKQAPNDPLVRARLGMCRFLQGRTEEARALMEGAAAELPRDPALLVALANLDLQEGRGPDAERRLRTVLQADPSDTEALFVLASALQFQGKTAEAAAVLAEHQRTTAVVDRINALLKDKADSPTATADDYAEIGELFLAIHRDTFGVYWSERALELNGVNQRAHRALAAYYERKGDTARADTHRRLGRGPAAPASPPAGATRPPGP